jgi:hypothetical protein
MNIKYRFSKEIIIPVILLLMAGCSKETPEELPVHNDYLVLTEAFDTINKDVLKLIFASQGYGQYASLMKSNVRLLRVVYATEYPKGKKIKASGALLVSENFDPRFPVTVFTHGTYSDRDVAPSTEVQKPMPSSMDVFLGMAIASTFDCALLMPDYIGYGESKSVTHPYMHGESLGQAGLDLISAFREYAASPAAGLSFNSNIFITGYSEGGYAAVALHKAVDEHPADGLKVIKNVAGAGAYDMEAFSKEVLSNTQALGAQMRSSYLWVINMYKKDFGYSKAYADIFSETDNSLLQSIDHDMAYFADETAKLPLNDVAGELFRPEFISGILDGTDTEFIRISHENSFTDFVPKDSLIFVWGDADNWVYPVNSENAYNAMRSKGCKVAACIQPGGDHATTMPLYVDIVLGRLQATEREIK